MKTLKELFLAELAHMYDAERRIMIALPKLAKAATSVDLKEAICTHLLETEAQPAKLDQIFKLVGARADGRKCEAAIGLLAEGEETAEAFKGSPAIDAALISAVQKVEHYEIASYGCLRDWAMLLENSQAADLLEEILNEERAADQTLLILARSRCNEEALGELAELLYDDGEKGKIAPGRRAIRPGAARGSPLNQ